MAYEKINAEIIAEGFEVRPSFTALEPEMKVAIMAGIKGDKGDKGEKGDTGATGSTGMTGATGTGISGITQNPDGTVTIVLTDGTDYTTAPMKGAKGDKGDTGEQGEQGNGIASAVLDSGTYELTLTFDDGTTYTTPPIRGERGETGEQGVKGDTGATGNGIASAVLNSDYTLTLTFTDGTFYTTPSIRGAQGDTGAKGETGATGNGISSITKTGTVGLVDTYTITFTDGTTTTFTVTNGEDGAGQVESVNGKTGVVVLDSTDVGALPSSTSIPSKTSDLTNDSGYITSAQAPVTSVNGMTGDVTVVSGVTSVNGQSGAVVLDADDVGALPDDTSIPSATSDLTNDSGFVSSQQTEKIFVQGTTPSTASDGDIWIDTATQSASGIAYLPLSAGSNHHVTGDLYVDQDILDASGDAFISGNGTHKIYVSPSTPSSPAQGDLWVNPDGDWQGDGYGTIYEGTGTIPHSYSGSEVNTPTTILEIASVPQGTYILFGYLTLAFSSSTAGQAYINFYNNGSAITYDLRTFSTRASMYLTSSTLFVGSGRLTLALDSNVASTVRGTFKALRLR